MYQYEWDSSTGGYILNPLPLAFSKEPRPVYYKELDILGFDKYWNYDKNDSFPYMWAEANNYIYRGRLVAKTKGGSIYKAPELILIEDPEPDGEPLRFVDIPAMVEKNREVLEQITQDTIRKIYNTYVEYRDKVDVFYVAFSGGKDSVVALDLVQRALPHNEFKVLFGDTGMEFPDTYDVVEKVKNFCIDNQIDFLISKSEFNPLDSWRIFGPPAQRIRWCCSVHKTAPQVILLREYTGKSNFRGMAFTGIRGDESVTRNEYDEISSGDKIRGQYSFHPILEWNSVELFLYIFAHDLIFNEAYKLGNSRAGCLVCPMATNKNIYFKEIVYGKNQTGHLTTTDFNNIILDTSSKSLTTKKQIEEFMDIAGWKARRSGRELSFAKNIFIDNFSDNIFTVTLLQKNSDWREWIKTIGKVNYLANNFIEIFFANNTYKGKFTEETNTLGFSFELTTHTKTDIQFMSVFKVVMRKTAYCVSCRVCEANCPFGYIKFTDGKVTIDDRCVKCRKCHDIFSGCLLANSLKLPKGDKKMVGINHYGNMGVEFNWLEQYIDAQDDFWTSAHSLGSKKITYLSTFLEDAGIATKLKKGEFPSITDFGKLVGSLGIDNITSWALIAVNWAYSSQFNWWVNNIDFNTTYSSENIWAMLDDSLSETVRTHIVSAFKNIFISNSILGEDLGFGVCDYEIKNNGRTLNFVIRQPWQNPDDRVILYSLYKFSENCGNYRQFTLTRLLDTSIESDGISPTQIFGLDRDTMEKFLNGLSLNYPELIDAKFTLGLDSITLKSDKTAEEVLFEIFKEANV